MRFSLMFADKMSDEYRFDLSAKICDSFICVYLRERVTCEKVFKYKKQLC